MAALLQGTSFRAPSNQYLTAHFAVALSGGADSMALALLAHRWAHAQNIQLTTFTVDHGLRAESADEAAHVARWMQAHGIAHHILTPAPMPGIRNPQAQARARRYAALAQACAAQGITHLLLGHHADDQAETVALQQHRGDSPPSRAGMAAVSHRGALILLRPLLGTRKQRLIDYLREQQQDWVEDPSNQSDRYARNRLRKTVSEAETIALWHAAQRAGEQRHTAEMARNAWMLAHTNVTAEAAILNRIAWLALAPETRMDYLSHAIRRIGRKNFRPRLHETARLAAQIMQDDAAAATLGHCRIAWGNGTVRIAPEHRATPGVDAAGNSSHIVPPSLRGEENNPLVSPPFWWFNLPLDH